MNRALIIILTFLLTTFKVESQQYSVDAEFYSGKNYLVESTNDELDGGFFYGFRVKPSYWLNQTNGISTGLDISKSYILGLKDYSVLLGCDNQNGRADTLNSYFLYGVERVDLRIPVSYTYRYRMIEVELGLNVGINLKNEIRSHLVECGECGRRLEFVGDWEAWEVKPMSLGLSLGMSIGVLAEQRLRIFPRIDYQLFNEDGNAGLTYRELLLKVGLIYRIEKDDS